MVEIYAKVHLDEINVWILRMEVLEYSSTESRFCIWSNCEGLDEDTTNTRSSSTWGRGVGSLVASVETSATCRLKENRMPLDATIVDGYEEGFVEKEVEIWGRRSRNWDLNF